METKGITVYCASSTAVSDSYFEAARRLGTLIARSGLPLITGAGNMGLMVAVNDAAISAGGVTIGVIPRFMVERGWHHTGLSQLIVTDGMHSRKETMASLARGVIALPGGIGTFEELMEIITWRQLGLYDGNIVIYNVDGYYDNLLAMLDTAMERGFMKADHSRLWTVATDAAEALAKASAEPDRLSLTPKF
ncbi:MAG: TIGR00730 family Rossman fold protein [Muribaculaceae bacterium]